MHDLDDVQSCCPDKPYLAKSLHLVQDLQQGDGVQVEDLADGAGGLAQLMELDFCLSLGSVSYCC